MKILDSEIADAAGAPGDVVGVSDGGIVVAADGGGILIEWPRPHDGGTISASEYIADAGIAAGARLGE